MEHWELFEAALEVADMRLQSMLWMQPMHEALDQDQHEQTLGHAVVILRYAFTVPNFR